MNSAKEPAVRVMGILNVTPDSFFDGGRYADEVSAIQRAYEMIDQGADIIDIGGESSRPGAAHVSAEEEQRRVLPVIRELKSHRVRVTLSIDSAKPAVVRAALDAGADMINDITGFSDPAMAQLLVDGDCPGVLMHMRGTPQTMQNNPQYDDLIGEVVDFFRRRVAALGELGVNPHNLILDPGIGFGKTVQHNLTLINRVDRLRQLGHEVLVGASRKSFIGKILVLPEEDRLVGSLAALAVALMRGATLFRVHDVKETVQALKIMRRIVEAT